MIPQYYKSHGNENWQDDQFEHYITKTTTTKSKEIAVEIINRYLHDNIVHVEVNMKLNEVLKQIDNIPEIHIVTDGSYRNFVLFIRPDGYLFSAPNPTLDSFTTFDEYIEILKANNAIFFLQLSTKKWAEVDNWLRSLGI